MTLKRPLAITATGMATAGMATGMANGNGNGNSNGNGNGGGSNGGGNAQRGLNSWDFWSLRQYRQSRSRSRRSKDCRDGSGRDSTTSIIWYPGCGTASWTTIRDALRDRIQADNSTRWDQSTRSIISNLPDWRSSPKVIKVAIYNPEHAADLGTGQRGRRSSTTSACSSWRASTTSDNITGRFLYYVTGTGSGDEDDDGGSLVKHVRLVE